MMPHRRLVDVFYRCRGGLLQSLAAWLVGLFVVWLVVDGILRAVTPHLPWMLFTLAVTGLWMLRRQGADRW